MEMAINVYEYGRGGKCVCMLRYTSAGIRIINMQIEKEDRHMSRVMRITRAPCQRCVLNWKKKKKEKKKVVMNTISYTEARNTGRKTGREESIHKQHRLVETGKQTRNVREGHRGYYW